MTLKVLTEAGQVVYKLRSQTWIRCSARSKAKCESERAERAADGSRAGFLSHQRDPELTPGEETKGRGVLEKKSFEWR